MCKSAPLLDYCIRNIKEFSFETETIRLRTHASPFAKASVDRSQGTARLRRDYNEVHMLNRFLTRIPFNFFVILFLPLAAAQSLSTVSYRAAGVLPTYMKRGILYAVVAREGCGKDKGTYDSFAGSRDAYEHNPTVTAAREAHEEMISHHTMHLSPKQLERYIDPDKNHTTLVVVYQKFNYVLYVTRFDKYIDNFLRSFYGVLGRVNQFKYKEKDRIAIVAWDELKQAILQNKSQVCAEVLDPNTNRPIRCMITLRPILIKSLRPVFRGDGYQQGKNGKIRFY
jgi:hypothetical protein